MSKIKMSKIKFPHGPFTVEPNRGGWSNAIITNRDDLKITVESSVDYTAAEIAEALVDILDECLALKAQEEIQSGDKT